MGAWRTTFRCDTEDAGQDHNVLTEEGDNGMMLGSTTGHCGGLETDAEVGERAGWESLRRSNIVTVWAGD